MATRQAEQIIVQPISFQLHRRRLTKRTGRGSQTRPLRPSRSPSTQASNLDKVWYQHLRLLMLPSASSLYTRSKLLRTPTNKDLSALDHLSKRTQKWSTAQATTPAKETVRLSFTTRPWVLSTARARVGATRTQLLRPRSWRSHYRSALKLNTTKTKQWLLTKLYSRSKPPLAWSATPNPR